MPADTTTHTVGEIVEELDDRLDEIAAAASDAVGEQQQALDQEGIRVEQQLTAFEQLADEAGARAEIAVAELTADERMRFGDLLEAASDQAEQREGYAAGSNMREVYWTGAGVVDAPWLDGEESMQGRIAALQTQADWHVIQHLKGKVTEANDQGNPERGSYEERRTATTSTNESATGS